MRTMRMFVAGCLTMAVGWTGPVSAEQSAAVAEQVYQGEAAALPGPWALRIPRPSIILVSDAELETLASEPDKVIDLRTSAQKRDQSLRQVCEAARKQGARTLIVAYDHFFQQYRSGQKEPRRLMPDTDAYIEKIAKVGKFAEGFGLGLELSLITPLEIGRGYRQATGESGEWMQYRKGLRDPADGTYSVELWRHLQWGNNKGVFDLEDSGVRVFAFREQPVAGTLYRAVPEASITEITASAHVERLGGIRADRFPAERIRVYGTGKVDVAGLNRVLVVQRYRTPEMDCFSEKALPYLKGLIDRYAAAGVKLNGLYSDEPHLMGDWAYDRHHEHGQFAMRYVTPGLADRFARQFGEKYRDFAKYLVYFTYGQEDAAIDLSATEGAMHVFGASPVEIRKTALFRARYYRLLQDGVADLLVEAKRHAERRMGHRLEARGHATWAESPTCDRWMRFAGVNPNRSKYEYTSDFLWSNTIQQHAVGCSDYFDWGDFLTGNGNDHAEGGFLDRNYTGLTLACSLGILNEVPRAYGAHWGMPAALSQRRSNVAACFGVLNSICDDVQDLEHRDVDVLMLYPFDLTAVEEKYGSWMTQYAYANYVTQGKLLERGRVVNGAIDLAGRHFTTLAATFEPFPDRRLLELMRQMAEQGGRVIWSGPPPVLSADGGDALAPWSSLFGVSYAPGLNEGMPAPGRRVLFSGALKHVTPQVILTHELVDRIYPVTPATGAVAVAHVQGQTVGTVCVKPTGGTAVFLGFRPQDNQSCSLGYEQRTWFEVLDALGAYPASGKFPGVNDNTEWISRTGDYLVCRFPNGTITLAPHLRLLEEDSWSGGFSRDAKADAEWAAKHGVPSDKIVLQDFKVNGHSVSYEGTGVVAFRLNAQSNLLAFAGMNCRGITVDGRATVFGEKPLARVVFAPLHPSRRVPGGAVASAQFGEGSVQIPAVGLPDKLRVFVSGAKLGSKDGGEIACRREADRLVVTVPPSAAGRTLWLVPAE